MFLAISTGWGWVIDTEFLWQTLGNGNVSLIHSSHGLPPLIGNSTTEDRRQKLSRYRNKKTKRNFGRKIKVVLIMRFFFLSPWFHYMHILPLIYHVIMLTPLSFDSSIRNHFAPSSQSLHKCFRVVRWFPAALNNRTWNGTLGCRLSQTLSNYFGCESLQNHILEFGYIFSIT